MARQQSSMVTALPGVTVAFASELTLVVSGDAIGRQQGTGRTGTQPLALVALYACLLNAKMRACHHNFAVQELDVGTSP